MSKRLTHNSFFNIIYLCFFASISCLNYFIVYKKPYSIVLLQLIEFCTFVRLYNIRYMGQFFHLKTDATTITEATMQLKANQRKENPIEMIQSMLPAEWFPQSGIELTWPHDGTDWKPWLNEVTELYVKLAYHISMRERLIVITPEKDAIAALLKERLPQQAFQNITLVECPTNDTWSRDHGFISFREEGVWTLKDFRFNGWGQKYPAELDNKINLALFKSNTLRGNYQDCQDFVLEGGAIDCDGRGTLLTTSRCLLNPNRNPRLSQTDIENRLKEEFYLKRILWIRNGELLGDDTDGHVDMLARFCPGDVIAYTQCKDTSDEQYDSLHAMEEELQQLRTLENKPYKLIPLPTPDAIIENGKRLPASYANFLIINGAVLMPTYGQPEADGNAIEQLQEAFPEHAIIGIDCRTLIRQGGSLHCSTMQFPKGIVNS